MFVFVAILHRGAGHESCLGHKRRNRSKSPWDWPTFMQAILVRFEFNIRAEEVWSRLIGISEVKKIPMIITRSSRCSTCGTVEFVSKGAAKTAL